MEPVTDHRACGTDRGVRATRPYARGIEEASSLPCHTAGRPKSELRVAVRGRRTRPPGWWLCYFLAAVGLAGCTSLPLAPTGDPDQERLVLVTGYFERSVSAESQCENLERGIIVDCFDKLRSAYLNVDRVLAGKLRAHRVRVEYTTPSSSDADYLWIGAGSYQLVALSLDGTSKTVHAHRTLHQLQSGRWALPVIGEYDLEIVPCDLRGLARPMDFKHEPPKYQVGKYVSDFVTEAQASGVIDVQGEFFYARQGIPINDLRLILRSLPEISYETYRCH